MKIGILGLGTVGGGVWDILSTTKFQEYDIKVKTALVRNKSKYISYEEQGLNLTLDPYEILNDPEIDTVVEVMGGIDKPYEYIKYALSQGKHVVTANKAVLAKHMEEFLALAKNNNAALLYEASVGGGIPLIKPLKQNARINNFYEISGILNGTSNFILSKMSKEGLEFADVLKQAQEKGYAEQDPSDDIDGTDMARKISVLSSTIFKKHLPLEHIQINGIRHIEKQDMDIAKKAGCDIKLIAKSNYENNNYKAAVEPVILKQNSIFAQVSDEYNIGMAKGDNLSEVSFYGEGAGRYATANAVVSDLLDIYNHEAIEHLAVDFSSTKVNPILADYYVRLNDTNKIEELKAKLSSYNLINLHKGAFIAEKITSSEIKNYADEINVANQNYFIARLDDALIPSELL
ncbi:Homoserine dehydrogenase [Acetoanaerobium sticklandii]|uniref:Homoserine dehydrogenase n=1 Tax=Acetoanaerobium sticklandii (strain ATCC 12662 / DSM 519 / JCM 1433 / CCUG 9281 / NCIMB 10654 / HF) TaxID=499177 RepID=E3PX61_ACESD|nr:homoserine dehydrogenase [Acetoanaerobium sticklandii]CBH21026.1 Homoserine dehydrogenase [Acetoanaerobium sticklandii]